MPAAEVSLVMLLETVLGPLWVWLAVDERPSDYTFAGGALLIVVLVVNAVLAIREEHRRLRATALPQSPDSCTNPGEQVPAPTDPAPAPRGLRIYSVV